MADINSFANYITYVEPNYDNNAQNIEMQPSLEDMCVSVNIAVIIPQPQIKGKVKTDNKVVLMSWDSSKENGNAVNFLGGTIMRAEEGNEQEIIKNYLTTDYTKATFADVKSQTNSEMFGISSVNIQYNDYNTPQITVEFVDIRGISLFSPEEYSHDGIGEEHNTDIAGSFFKCFFMFPYPIFYISIKGVYGEPVCYELTCSEFRARFDANTGNFGATAKFIGHSFALLSDITLNALIAAPLSEYYGRAYWDKRVAEGAFTWGTNQSPLPRLTEFIEQYQSLNKNLSQIDNIDNSIQEKKTIENHLLNLNSILDSYKVLWNTFKTSINAPKNDNVKKYGVKQVNLISSNEIEGGVFVGLNSKVNLNDDNKFKQALQNLKDVCKKSNIGITTDSIEYTTTRTKFIENWIVPIFGDINGNHKIVKNHILNIANFYNGGKEFVNDKNLEPYKYGYYFCGTKFLEQISNKISDYNRQLNAINDVINSKKGEQTIDLLRIEPSVYNITKMLMAHLETFLYCINKCHENILESNRTIDSMGLRSQLQITNKISNGNGDTYVGPFPDIAASTINSDGTQDNVDIWLGDVINKGKAEEVELVHGLLNAVFETNDAMQNIDESNVTNETSEKPSNLQMEVPVSPIDFTLNKPIWGNVDINDDLSVVGAIGVRAMTSLGLNVDWCNNDTALAREIGKGDAINFANCLKKVSNDIKNSFSVGINNESNLIIRKLLSSNWNDNSLIKENGEYYELNVAENGFIPIQNIIFSNTNRNIGTNDSNQSDITAMDALQGSVGINMDDYIQTLNVEGTNENAILGSRYLVIDEDYQSWSEQFKTVYGDGNDFYALKDKFAKGVWNADEYEKFYSNDSHTVAEKFSYKCPSDKELTYTPCEKSGLFPKDRDGLKNESIKEVFSGDYGNWMFNGWRVSVLKSEYNGECFEIKNGNNSSHNLIEELDNIQNYTIPLFNCLAIDDTRSTNGMTLFSQASYYEYETSYARACAYLCAMMGNSDSISHEVDGINYSKAFDDFWKLMNITVSQDNQLLLNSQFCILPYQFILFIGGYLWSVKQENYQQVLFKEVDGKVVRPSLFRQTAMLNKIRHISKLENLRQEVKEYLIDKFITWVDNDFKVLTDALELHDKDGNVYTTEKLLQVAQILNNVKKGKLWFDNNYDGGGDVDTIINCLYDNFDDRFFENYISFSYGDNNDNGNEEIKKKRGFRLVNRETSPYVQKALGLLMQPCLVLNTSHFLNSKRKDNVKVKKNILAAYFDSFIKELNKIYTSTVSEENEGNNTIVSIADTSTHIKCAFYKYIKVVYDKWLKGNVYGDNTSHWNIENFFEPHFHFLDTFYNYKADVYCDIDMFVKRIKSSQSQETYSLLDFMSNVYSDNKFMFQHVQNFLNYGNSESMANLFTPIPFHKINHGDLSNTYSDFVIMQRSEPSKHLNIGGKDDSFDLREHTDIPIAISSKTLSQRPKYLPLSHRISEGWNGIYKVPCFGVSYGRQYQSYFSDVSVSMDNPIATEQSIKAQMAIIGMGNDSEDNASKRQVWAGGQDLYSVYANNSYTCTVKMMGCAWIQPLMYFTLLNIPMFKGAYLIQKVSHQITPGKMETTFVGTRMAKKSLPTVNELYTGGGVMNNGAVTATNSGVNGGNSNIVSKKDEQYKVFYPKNENGGGVTDDFLNKTIGVIVEESGRGISSTNNANKWHEPFYKQYSGETLLDTLACTLYYEAVGEDELGQKLVASTLYNRYKKGGLHWWVFGYKQTAWYGKGGDPKPEAKKSSKYNKLKEYIKDIWLNTPSILVGIEVTPNRSVPVYCNNQRTGGKTQTKTLTLNDVQKMLYYCTTDGYDKDGVCKNGNKQGQPPCEAQNSSSPWWGGEYLFHHKGHVFNGYEKLWDVQPKNQSATTNIKTNKEKLDEIVDCIEQTCQHCKSLGIQKLHRSYALSGGVINNNAEWMMLWVGDKMTPKKENAKLFDVILTTYSDRVSQIYWVVDNDSSCYSYPFGIRISLNIASSKQKQIGVVKGRDGKPNYGPHQFIIDDIRLTNVGYEGIFNELFYSSLSKKYGILNSKNIKEFKTDVRNYNNDNLYKNDNYLDIINDLLT